ncbi:glycosyltransferase [Longilinea arvoryzae]|uniref:Glycosyltransferase n=1 Tax=Longilinea arvoryzae TaxID=360412 RepID=A0A0S7BDM6_9CHLR|nr:glycosyltransferase [Longilinea arvoryzae]GAP13465.1 glycosyltransferase [Longilinea arvoryzae]
MPKVSIIIPTYNSARFLPATLQSVLAQTYRDYEILVVDDGSTDDTPAVLQPYRYEITYIHQENKERSAARNNAIDQASGEYVAFLDSDDLWAPEKLKRQVAVLDAHPEVALVYCQARYIDENGQPTAFCGDWIDGPKGDELVIADYFEALLGGNVISGGGSTSMVRRWMLNQVGPFDVTLNHGEDWDVWLRLSRLGPFAYLPEPLTSYRVYGWKRLLTHQSTSQAIEQHLRVIDKNMAGWDGDPVRGERLRKNAMRGAYLLAALGGYQLGNFASAMDSLARAVQLDPNLGAEQEILWLAVDRAKIIERASGSYAEAIGFMDNVFDHLPPELSGLRISRRQAAGWLYISGAFEQHQQRNDARARRLLVSGLLRAPRALRNRGVLSILADVSLGRPLAAFLKGHPDEEKAA